MGRTHRTHIQNFGPVIFKKGNLGEVEGEIFKRALRKQRHSVWAAFVLLEILTSGGS